MSKKDKEKELFKHLVKLMDVFVEKEKKLKNLKSKKSEMIDDEEQIKDLEESTKEVSVKFSKILYKLDYERMKKRKK